MQQRLMIEKIPLQRQDTVKGYVRSFVSLIIPLPIIDMCIVFYGNPHDLKKLVQDCSSDTAAIQLGCTTQLRRMLSKINNPPIKSVIDSGVVPRLLQLCNNTKRPQIQYESMWALLNIASGPSECTDYILRHGSHNIFIDSLKSPLYEIVEQALWALGNIAGDGAGKKDLLLNNNILPDILKICTSKFDKQHVTNFNNLQSINDNPMSQFTHLLNTCSWTLSNLCRGSAPPNMKELDYLVSCLKCLLDAALDMDIGDEIISNIGWAFSYLTGYDRYNRELINKMDEMGILQQFVELIDHKCAQVRHPINRCIGNILTGPDQDTKKCLDLGILKKYSFVLNNINTESREKREICWSLSNVCATGDKNDSLLVLKEGLFEILIDYLENTNYETSKEALWAISNATDKCDENIISHLIENNLQNALYSWWRKYESKIRSVKRILLVALECIENVLIVGEENLGDGEENKFSQLFEECDIVTFLEELQTNDEDVHDEVYIKSVAITQKYSLGSFKKWDCMCCGLRNGSSSGSCQACFNTRSEV